MDAVKLFEKGGWLVEGKTLLPIEESDFATKNQTVKNISSLEGKKQTISYSILTNHNTSSSEEKLKIRFDAIASHDITYVGIIQTARASGLEKFPLPYVLTNCHNSLCAVGGTINEDDHLFGLSAAKKYGGMYVPAHQAVIHQFMREMFAGCGKMILGSDSHTRYGALGTMAIGEGGPELVKQLLCKTYDIDMPEVVAVYLEGNLRNGVGPQDVALALIGSVFANGFVKNRVLEFVGPGISSLGAEFRNGIDVMTTETTCLSSVWVTDETTKDYLNLHGRMNDYKKLEPGKTAFYDRIVKIDLSEIKPMIALPFHPSNVYTIDDLIQNPLDIFSQVEKAAKKQLNNDKLDFSLTDKIVDGKIRVDQGVIAGCAGGTFDNLVEAAHILKNKNIGFNEFALSIYPSSQPIYQDLVQNGVISQFMESGATVRTAFCGPCFGAGDVPANGGLSIRHSTRNFPNREGSKPGAGQIASVALMDARSIAATAANGGILTSAENVESMKAKPAYHFNKAIYENRCYNGIGKPQPELPLKFGPNITDWPSMVALTDSILLQTVSVINDPVTTTDELIPSGETSSYRSNPLKLAEFTLSRKDPEYVQRAKDLQTAETARREGKNPTSDASVDSKVAEVLKNIYNKIPTISGFNSVTEKDMLSWGLGSVVFALKPGDGSAREQAASCQKVLGGWANIAVEYATKRYRSNLINWGMLPLLLEKSFINKDSLPPFKNGDFIFISKIREAVQSDKAEIEAWVIPADEASSDVKKITLQLGSLTPDEKQIILDGCLINYYRNKTL